MSNIYIRDKILELIEEGIIDKDTLFMAFLKYLSEDQIRECLKLNEISLEEIDASDGI